MIRNTGLFTAGDEAGLEGPSSFGRRGRIAFRFDRCPLINSPNPLFDCYRLILAEPATRRVFAERRRLGWRLPQISIPRWSRAAEQIQMVIERQLGFKAVVVDLLVGEAPREAIAIAEVRGGCGCDPSPGSGSWIDFYKLSEDEIDGPGRSAVEGLLNEGGTGRGLFSRFGWIEEALEWVSTRAGTDRAEFTDEFKQFNATADSALVRFGRRSASPIWLKASWDRSAGEYRITTALALLVPDSLPRVIATREDWSAWWMEDAGTPLGSVPSPGAFAKAISRLAEIEKASMDSTSHLLESGCGDQRLPVLRASISPIMDLIDRAMAGERNDFTPRLASARLRELEVILTDICLSMESLGIPDALLHGDISFENILVGSRGCVFTDWANAAVGNPFVTFEQLRAQIEQENGGCVWLPMLTEIYVGSWLEVLSRSQIECALALASPVAAMTYLFDHCKRLGRERRSEPQFQSCVRAIARQIDRAAHEIQLRWSRCA